MARRLFQVLTLVALLLPGGALLAAPGSPSLNGRALDEAGRLLDGVQVLLQGAGRAMEALERRTDHLGRFSFPRLPRGSRFLLVATKGGYLASVVRLENLPASLDIVLRSAPAIGDNDPVWILRLPARDVLRHLSHGGFQEREASASPPALAVQAEVEQLFGLPGSMGAGSPGDGEPMPDLGTQVSLSGGQSSRASWSSQAHYSGQSIGRAATGDWQRTTGFGVAGSADIDLGGDARLQTAVRAGHRRLERSNVVDPSESRTLGVDIGSQIDPETRLDLHLRDVSAHRRADSSEPGLHRQAIALKVARNVPLGDSHTLTASLDLQEFGGNRSETVMSREAARPGEAFWLAPERSRAVIGLRDAVGLTPELTLGYGAEVRHELRAETGVVPGVDVEWSPLPGTTLNSGIRYHHEGGGGDEGAGALSVNMQVSQRFRQGTTVAFGVRDESLRLMDPFSQGSSFVGIWTDGHARARELELAVDHDLGPVRGHVTCRYGEMDGTLSVPDPFEMIATPLGRGQARYAAVEAGAHLPGSGTEVSVAVQQVESSPLQEVRILGVRVSQGLPATAIPGEWRLLFDYEGIDGGAPFQTAGRGEAPAFVGRVSGGVAIRF